MNSDVLVERICRRSCRYYKPSKGEELSCLGFLVIRKLDKSGKNITFGEVNKRLAGAVKETLTVTMCPACPFYQDDCDFAMKREGSLPCGGFLVLGSLLEEGDIHIDEIREVIYLLKRTCHR